MGSMATPARCTSRSICCTLPVGSCPHPPCTVKAFFRGFLLISIISIIFCLFII